MSLVQICEALLDRCLAPDLRMGGIGCDNMTVILVCFLHSGPYSSLVEKCSRANSLPSSQTTAYHHWAHKKNNILMHRKRHDSDNDEEMLTFGTSPKSKLNDTVSSANTDLDSELESSKEKSGDYSNLFRESPVDVTVTETRGRSHSDTSSEEASLEENDYTPVSVDGVAPIETMV